MSTHIHSKNQRISGILINDDVGVDSCDICGKATTKRKGKRPAPAPIHARFEFKGGVFRNDFASDYPAVVWELAHSLRVGVYLCLACAKRLSSRLDAVIDQIERKYK